MLRRGSRENSRKDEKDWTKIAARRGNGPILRDSTLKLIEHSTVCVFQWNKSMYRCFCCKQPFLQPRLLHAHTRAAHTTRDVEREIIAQQNRMVKAEVSNIQCKLCNFTLDNLDHLTAHLQTEHSVKFELTEHLLVPFKLDADLQCQICQQKFTVFRLLNIHMNQHYQKQVCHVCGAGFSNLVFLNLHKTRYHGVLKCKHCDLVFNDKKEKRSHDATVHNVKAEKKNRFPCPYCPERFNQEKFRILHQVEHHGVKKPEYKCKFCSKLFVTKSLCTNHMKIVHMKSKNQECGVCFKLFFSKYDLSRHRVTHTGEKNYVCPSCNNTFATKDSLRRHLKKSHASGDK